jgi:hypothetical protein
MAKWLIEDARSSVVEEQAIPLTGCDDCLLIDAIGHHPDCAGRCWASAYSRQRGWGCAAHYPTLRGGRIQLLGLLGRDARNTALGQCAIGG